MARDTELAKLKTEIEAVEKKGRATRYPDPLRRRVVAFVASQKTRGIPIARTCKALGLTLESVDCWRRTVPGTAIVPVGFQKVEIITEPQQPRLVVHGPRGLRVEGVSVAPAGRADQESCVIGSTRQLTVYAYVAPCDMRKQYDSLAAVVTQHLGRDVLAGDAFLFVGRDQRRAKVLWWDGTGLCVFSKRLEKGRFAAPWKHAQGREMRMTMSELTPLLEGSELVGRVPLSPPPFVPGERTVRFR